MKVVAIHQANFIPWLGYFNKIHRSDKFIVLDHVQFPKKGGNWMNRVQLLVSSKPNWVTVSINRAYAGLKSCRDIEIDFSTHWQKKILQTVKSSYGKTLFFDEVYPDFERLVLSSRQNLIEFNLSLIYALSEKLGLDTKKFVCSSELDPEGNATDLLISLVRQVGGDAYLCGGGASGYQEDQKFADGNIKLLYQNFTHPVYNQLNSEVFVPGLSVLDALMNCGFEKTASLIGSA